MALAKFSSALRDVFLPPWLRRGNAERLVFAFGVHFNLVADAAVSAVKKRFPGTVGRADALAVLGRERGILRGAAESDEAYAARLRTWLIDTRRKGNPYALLSQVFGYFTGSTRFPIELIYANGTRFSMDVNGAIVRDTVPLSVPGNWAVWWLIYTVTSQVYVADWLRVPRAWGTQAAAHTNGTLIVLTGTGEFWDFPAPVGTWDDNDSVTWGSPDQSGVVTVQKL